MPSRFVTHFGQSNVTAVEVISSDVKKRKTNRSDVEKRSIIQKIQTGPLWSDAEKTRH